MCLLRPSPQVSRRPNGIALQSAPTLVVSGRRVERDASHRAPYRYRVCFVPRRQHAATRVSAVINNPFARLRAWTRDALSERGDGEFHPALMG